MAHIDISDLQVAIAHLSEYVHDSEDIPSWDVEEIDSKLDDILTELDRLGAEEPLSDRDKSIIDLARERWARDGEIEIDADARVSESEMPNVSGAYVQSWLWVDFAGTDLVEEDAIAE